MGREGVRPARAMGIQLIHGAMDIQLIYGAMGTTDTWGHTLKVVAVRLC